MEQVKRKKKPNSERYRYWLNSFGMVPISLPILRMDLHYEDDGVEMLSKAFIIVSLYVVYYLVVKILCDIYRKICEEK